VRTKTDPNISNARLNLFQQQTTTLRRQICWKTNRHQHISSTWRVKKKVGEVGELINPAR
jgi:hypothetical protein